MPISTIENTVKKSASTEVIDQVVGASTDAKLLKVSLDKIQGMHPALILLEEELEIPPLKLPSKYAISLNKEILSMLARKPPIVFRSKRLWCVGNGSAFKLAKAILSPDTQINCIEYFALTDDQIRADHLTELLFDAAVFGIHASDLAILVEAARKAIRKNLWKPSDSPMEDYLSALYCVDKRKFKRQTKADCIDPAPVNAQNTSTQDESSPGISS